MPLGRPCSKFHVVALLVVVAFVSAPDAHAANPGPWERISYNELPRFKPAWAYDSIGHRMIYYGTDYEAQVGLQNHIYTAMELTLGANPTWRTLAVTGSPPGNSNGGSAIFDPVGNRIIWYGTSGLWALSLGPVPAWTPLAAGGNVPMSRYEHTAIYDPVGHRMIIHGGQTDWVDVYALSLGATPTWTKIEPAGPVIGHHWAAAIYDPIGHRMIVDGGEFSWESGGFQWTSETWALSLDATPTWTRLTPASGLPPVHNRHGAIYDPVRHSMVIFGGSVDSGTPPYSSNEVWELSLGPDPQWTQRAPAGPLPIEREYPLTAYDPVDDRMILFGGWRPGAANASLYGDTWQMSLGTSPAWTQLAPDGSPPNLAPFSTSVIDPTDGSLLVYGGLPQGTKPVTELRAMPLSGPTVWRELHPSGTPPANRSRHSAIVDAANARMIVFGGTRNSDAVTTNETWVLQLGANPAWSQLLPAGTPPSARHSHSAIYDQANQRMLVYGGDRPGVGKTSELWALSLGATPAWSLLQPPAGPNPGSRAKHSAIYDPPRGRMVVFGGENTSGTLLSSLYALSLGSNPTWSLLSAGTGPAARGNHSAIYDTLGQRMVVFGGDDNGFRFNDVWLLPLWNSSNWNSTTLAEPLPFQRSGHGAVYDAAAGRMVIYGGGLYFIHNPGAVNDTWALPLGSCAPPIIVAQPESLSIPYGNTAVFNVTATGAASYRWRKNGTSMSNTSRVSGVTTSTLTITNFGASDVATYTVLVSGACNPDQVISGPAALAQAVGCNVAQASPPSGMAAWWAMDPGPGNSIPDVLNTTGNKNHASRTGNASLVPGKVGLAVRCEAAGDGLHVPSTLSPRLAAQSTGLSIDAWILPRAGHPAGGLRMILQKGLMRRGTVPHAGGSALAPGYAFWLRDDGRMAFQMPNSNYDPVTFEPAMPAVTAGAWQHVAVTVKPEPNGGRFFLNGVVVATFTPPSGILGNLADLYVGRFAPQTGPSGVDLGFHGDIDEVELFTTAVDSAAIRKIWAAGCAGKRRVQVATNVLAEIRSTTGAAEVCSVIRNLSLVSRTYQWSIAATGPATGCASSVPVTFTPVSGSVLVPAGGRADLTTVATVSGGSLGAPFTRCLRLTVTDQTDGGVMTADGSLTYTGAKVTGRVACTPPEVGAVTGEEFARIGDGGGGAELAYSGAASFTVTNDSTAAVTLDYVIETRDLDTGGASSLLRLGGLAAGAPLAGSVVVPAMGSAQVGVTVGLDEYEPFLQDQLLLTADRDGDALRETMAALRVVSRPDTSLALVAVEPVTPGAGGGSIVALRAAPNPSGGSTALLFTLTRGGRVEASIFDVAGRRVRRLDAGIAVREAGEQRLTWDGRDEDGRLASTGLYFVRTRVEGDGASGRTVRVVIVR